MSRRASAVARHRRALKEPQFWQTNRGDFLAPQGGFACLNGVICPPARMPRLSVIELPTRASSATGNAIADSSSLLDGLRKATPHLVGPPCADDVAIVGPVEGSVSPAPGASGMPPANRNGFRP